MITLRRYNLILAIFLSTAFSAKILASRIRLDDGAPDPREVRNSLRFGVQEVRIGIKMSLLCNGKIHPFRVTSLSGNKDNPHQRTGINAPKSLKVSKTIFKMLGTTWLSKPLVIYNYASKNKGVTVSLVQEKDFSRYWKLTKELTQTFYGKTPFCDLYDFLKLNNPHTPPAKEELLFSQK